MKDIKIQAIATVLKNEGQATIVLDEKYRQALLGLAGFSHLQMIWWAHEFDEPEMREITVMPAPYKKGPAEMGIFATRSPIRPNLLALSTVQVEAIDFDKGRLTVSGCDAHEGTPVLDLKPYTPSEDRIENPVVPEWCSHWPKSVETTGDFDWASEFNF
ncbi:tRNA-Thr(GGU) m(6)t(6)A37 methyltransferase TsaA [Enterococcus sp. PF1-24]|uniref:SAM-dependent methyltransferase n=1 Tax=unclassified Enterococcus TaxID=2608891 RepID=UPI002473BF11|nr:MULTISPECIES: SAM-dependent methyltransferase [unclassified Enterococcus]MDH6365419.1 tRNA-Thr(GGU) m(6)t(6)A37 methyltransferase TsaA [Enterococcus sp. PFB1-1]MDH6402509.1 tRNA-Thr(GGU) m(6)t(6)A37 methyltransferase TsaA [Enterococcus sp. PF1-24]